jgi:hypothetical protein
MCTERTRQGEQEMKDERWRDPFFFAIVDMIGRTGAKEFGLRFQDDEKPVIWMAIASFDRDGENIYEAAGALTPALAAFRLCELLMDGAECLHCHRPTGISNDFDHMPLEDRICWYQYDPELATFRRACEGSQQ